ncbi:transposase domain-containing protein [Epibacterium sp. MM17-32]|nr:transposase domain-containing protein [Epibacterium sp. MM17-32]
MFKQLCKAVLRFERLELEETGETYESETRNGVQIKARPEVAELWRAGELTPIWTPDEEQEAMRDLIRTRKQAMDAVKVAIGRKNWMFSGSEGGGRAMAIAFTLIETAKLNKVDPQSWLTWVHGRITDHKITRLDELIPWRYVTQAA